MCLRLFVDLTLLFRCLCCSCSGGRYYSSRLCLLVVDGWFLFLLRLHHRGWLALRGEHCCGMFVMLFYFVFAYKMIFCFLLPFFFAFVVLSWVVGSLYLSVSFPLLPLDMNWQQWRLTHASMSCSVTVGGVGRRLCFLAIVLDGCWFFGCAKSVKSLFQKESLSQSKRFDWFARLMFWSKLP